MADYVDLDPRTLRTAEERAEADAVSGVVSGPRVVGSRRHDAFWAAVAAKAGRAHVLPFAPRED